jgi:2-polyprenyl-3-methyl-5-hydroxy-6-metoxy-1,4-benzoquinol methylase
MDKIQRFSWKSFEINLQMMNARILSSISTHGWERTMVHLLNTGIPFSNMEFAEVGCGTGTFALILNLLGAKTTLIDCDEKAIEVAKKAFALYNRKAEFIIADVLKPVPPDLIKRFHCVVSGGLAEHFSGEARKICIKFHKDMVRKNGFVRVGVPNRLSPFYQMVRNFRMLTGTWELDIEIPFTPGELKHIAEFLGFKTIEVVGNHPLKRDLKDYSLGMGAAVLMVLPSLRKFIKRQSIQSVPLDVQKDSSLDILSPIKDVLQVARNNADRPYRYALKDTFSAGIILHGFV